METIYNFIDYRGVTPTKISIGVPLVTAKNVKDGFLDYSCKEYISREEFESRQTRGISQKGDILFTTEAPLGNVAIANLHEFSAGQRIITFQQYSERDCLSNEVIVTFMRTEIFRHQLNVQGTGSTVKGIKAEKLKRLFIPIPPSNEQVRIMEAFAKREQQLQAIHSSRNRYKRIISETPTSLRQQLIQSAIQGLLVPQNPSDEPASVLLERIAQERSAKLDKKAAKSMSRIVRRGSKTYELFPDSTEKDISEDIPFEIPRSWEWARGKSIFAETKNGVPERDFSYIDIDAIDNKRHIIKSGKPTKKEEAPSRARRILESGDVLFSLVRPYLENIALVGKQHASSIASTGFYVVRTKVLLPDFTYSLFLSPYVIHGLNSFMKGDNSPSIRSENIEDFLYPIPPLSEQQRIVRALYKILSHMAL